MRLVTRVVAIVLALFLPVLALGQSPAPPRRPSSSALASTHAVVKQRPADFGTVGTTYKQYSAVAFVQQNSSEVYSTSGPYSGQVLRTGAGNTLIPFAVNVDLPDGAVVTYLEIDGCDDTGGGAGDAIQGIFVAANSFGNVTYASPFVMSSGLGCGDWAEDLSGDNVVIDNFLGHYWLVAYTNEADPTVGFSGMVVGYHLQVPTPPGTSDFGDVPTSSPQYQFIEALYHAGITAGCGGGNYCPNDPVTRGQMAVFLAKALGLY